MLKKKAVVFILLSSTFLDQRFYISLFEIGAWRQLSARFTSADPI